MATVYDWDSICAGLTGSAGSTVYDWGSVGVLTGAASTLYATRAGASDKYLIDAATSLQVTDSGSPDYAYDGTGGSLEVQADPIGFDGSAIVAGDEVKTPYLWDNVNNQGVATLTSGVVPPGVTLRDSGIGTPSTTQYFSGLNLTGVGAVMMELTPSFSGTAYRPLLWINPADGNGFRITTSSRNSGTFRLGIAQGGSAVNIDLTGHSSAYNGVRCFVTVSVDGAGNYEVALYNNSGTLIDSGTASGSVVVPGVQSIGINTLACLGIIHSLKTWTSALSTSAASDVINGTTTSGWSMAIDGVRTGCHDPAATSKLLYPSAAGTLAVTLET